MNKKIVIKETDKLYSKKVKNKFVSEYLIYLTIDNINVMCFNEIGDLAKKERVNMLLLEQFSTIDLNQNVLGEIIEEITIE
jgi:hypothetical protein